jgi:hypothetical protein
LAVVVVTVRSGLVCGVWEELAVARVLLLTIPAAAVLVCYRLAQEERKLGLVVVGVVVIAVLPEILQRSLGLAVAVAVVLYQVLVVQGL